MTRFVSLAVFALMAVGVFGTDAAAQGFSWKSAAPDPAQPTVLKAYPWFEVQPLPPGLPATNWWRKGVGATVFPYSPFPQGTKWTVTEATVKTYTYDDTLSKYTLQDTITGTIGARVVNAAQSSSSHEITFGLPPVADGRAGYTPGVMVRVDVYIVANSTTGGVYSEMINRSTVAATPP